MATVQDLTLKTIGNSIKNTVSDVLASSDFISRTIGMANSYEDIMFIVQMLGREPVSLLGKNYAFIFDHVRRNYLQGMDLPSKNFEYCNKFTFYKEVPTVRFADPYNDPTNLLDRWVPDFKTEPTEDHREGLGASIHYSESDDGYTNNKNIGYQTDLDESNTGTYTGPVASFGLDVKTCDMIGKTNSNFNHGKYQTLIARFHTNSQESKDELNPTQTAFSKKYGQSHGRNLLRKDHDTNKQDKLGYDNPYCRVWTYHHQYNQIKRQIRPFNENTQVKLEDAELTKGYDTVGFRTSPSKNDEKIEGGSKRLDRHGVLNYQNGTVNIAPTAKIKDYFDHKDNDYDKGVISTKKCMFSIENLAWRDDKMRKDEFDAYGLSPEQKGPFGGRIMWFPPYNLKFNEDVSVDWNRNKFIGRGEDVYTYTNTERRGSLSFTLLIDHPSILDYWTGHERNGMKNQGVPLKEGNDGGVDGINNQEQTLLRFFAGCDILTAQPQIYRRRNVDPTVVEEPPMPKEPTVPPTDVHKKVKKTMYAILYYPNNYSGQDDDAEFAVNYLMNGIGTQKRILNGKAVDFAPDPTALNGKGYEVRDNGISLVTWDEVKETIKYGVTDVDKAVEGEAEAILPNKVTYGHNTYLLAKQIGSKASKGKDSTKRSSEWKNRRWYYRVDKTTENQRLVSKPWNYIDVSKYDSDGTTSHHLNTSGYNWVIDNRQFNLTEDDELVSFVDLYVALNSEASTVFGPMANDDNVKKIRKIKNQEDGYEVVSVKFRGHNSSHGRNASKKTNEKRNKDLSTQRALTLKEWMGKMNFPKAAEGGEPTTLSQTEEKNSHKTDSVDSPYIKAWRSAAVIIEYEKENTENAATAEQTVGGKDADSKVVSAVDKVEVKNKEVSKKMSPIEFLLYTNEGHSILSSHPELLSMNPSMKDIEKVTSKNYTNSDDWRTFDNSWKQDDTFTQSVVKRYDNEGEFFQTLSDKDPFLHHLISQKIKFFDPAFHSISPEGFNARLTFLHQCTRQGSTVGNADSSLVGTAYNLAFGRPPVCVLRLGDFYYTKIVITSLNIQYDQPQWDMNPEGIGMMPMFADITINFAFLGGSDLGGPIARLQNAVSFNYYANASVYDNRAEKVEYDPNGSGKEIAFKGYTYPNANVGNRLNTKKLGTTDSEGKFYAEDF